MSTVFENSLLTGHAQKEVNSITYPEYFGKDLGLSYSSQKSDFRIWSPAATEAQLLLYTNGNYGTPLEVISMEKKEAGVWFASLPGNLKGKFYVFRVKINGIWSNELPDPYAKAAGVNGSRSMIVDLKDTHPPGWLNDKSPAFKNIADAIIYEVHIRDITAAGNSGISRKGKYIGLAETGTTNEHGLSTGLDHIKELGVTHVHLLPVFDFASVDEARLDSLQYSWGYDPLNYNVPEGSYATNPYDGITRIKELKTLIKALHDNGLRVIMDVMYSCILTKSDPVFNQLVPGYYYRQEIRDKDDDEAARCYETASEKPMMRQFMLESLKYWVNEYHVDGFCFSRMGSHDIITMNLLAKELTVLKPNILLYGEGWEVATSSLPEPERATKRNAYQLNNIAVFSDEIRDGIRGSASDKRAGGFVCGGKGLEESIRFGVIASCYHPKVDYSKVNHSKTPYSPRPSSAIHCCENHYGYTLYDKLLIAAPDATEEQRKEMHKLALSVLLTSQGIPLLQAGTEFLRSKKKLEISASGGDYINAINWDLKTQHQDMVEYVKALIAIRKEHPAFKMRTAEQLQAHLEFEENLPDNVVAFSIDGAALNDDWRKIKVYYNGSPEEVTAVLETRNWSSAILNNRVVERDSFSNFIILQPYSCTILCKKIP